MKYFTLLTLLCLFTFTASAQAYLLAEGETDRDYLAKIISQKQQAQELGEQPVVVVNKTKLTAKQFSELQLTREEIKNVLFIKKDGLDLLQKYGEHGKDGAVVIFLNPAVFQDSHKLPNDHPFYDYDVKDSVASQNILYIVDGAEVPNVNIQDINSESVESMTVVKDKDKMKKYTAKDYDGIIIIKTIDAKE